MRAKSKREDIIKRISNEYYLFLLLRDASCCAKLLQFSNMPPIATEAYIKIGVLFDCCESKKTLSP
jgi:hypothetical protein